MAGKEDEQQAGAEEQPGAEPPRVPDDIEAMIEVKAQNAVQRAIQDTEIRLGQKIEQVARDIGQSLQPMVDSATIAMLPEIVKQLGEQVDKKLDGRASNPDAEGQAAEGPRPRGSLVGGVGSFLDKCTPKDILELVQAWKQPGSDQALAHEFATLLKGISMGQKLTTGNLTVTDLEGVVGTPAQK